MKNTLLKLLILFISFSLVLNVGSAAASTSTEIIRDKPHVVDYEFDKQGKVLKEIDTFLDGSKQIINYTYNNDGSVSQTATIEQGKPLYTEGAVHALEEDDDKYIYDWDIKLRLADINSAWLAASSDPNRDIIQSDLHKLAEETRADFIILHPESYYARLKLGGTSTTYPLNRNLTYNPSSPMLSGLDVTVIQRTLMLSEYLYVPKGEYGVYGPQTADAVSRFQSANNIVQNGTIGPDTFAAMFASTYRSERSSDKLLWLNIFKVKHNLVQKYATNQLMIDAYKIGVGLCTPTSGICNEVYIPGGGPLGGRGYADILHKSKKMVWEVKPDNERWNEKAKYLDGRPRGGLQQLQRYIDASNLPSNSAISYFPLTRGDAISPIIINWSLTQNISVRAGIPNDRIPSNDKEKGLIYYKMVDKTKLVTTSPVPVESVQTQRQPDAPTLKFQLDHTPTPLGNAAIGTYFVYKGAKFVVGVLVFAECPPLGLAIMAAP